MNHLRVAPADSRRRKASASLEQRELAGDLAGMIHSRRRKASASLELFHSAKLARLGSIIPDAERRLPHWSIVAPRKEDTKRFDSRRRKASASLEQRERLARRGVPEKFQTPKGVCLIGASPITRVKRGLRNSRRRKASASLERIRSRSRSCSRSSIPDAERRLPHWSMRMPVLANA